MNFEPMPVIVGCPRSGTTLLRFMLDAHPQLAIPPETGFLSSAKLLKSGDCEQFLQRIIDHPPTAPAWDDFHISTAEFHDQLLKIQPFNVPSGFRLFYKMYAARFEKSRWGDKTPTYSRTMLEIGKILPEAYFIHIIRDGRDVAVSLRDQWFSPGHDIEIQARYWQENVENTHHQGRQCLHYLEIRYEDLIMDTEAVLHKICNYLSLDFHSNMLKYYENSSSRLKEHLERRRADGTLLVSYADRQKQQLSTTQPPLPSKIGLWRTGLQAEEIGRYEGIAGPLLQKFEYPLWNGTNELKQ
jgi:LPS sulfotransferase NodH